MGRRAYFHERFFFKSNTLYSNSNSLPPSLPPQLFPYPIRHPNYTYTNRCGRDGSPSLPGRKTQIDMTGRVVPSLPRRFVWYPRNPRVPISESIPMSTGTGFRRMWVQALVELPMTGSRSAWFGTPPPAQTERRRARFGKNEHRHCFFKVDHHLPLFLPNRASKRLVWRKQAPLPSFLRGRLLPTLVFTRLTTTHSRFCQTEH